MANEFDILLKQLEVMEKIVISRPLHIDEKSKKTITHIINKIENVEELIMGDNFENISESVVINRSLLSNALQNIQSKYGEEFKSALEEISYHIEEQKSHVCGQLLEGFNKELSKVNQNQSKIKEFWTAIKQHLPDAAKIASSIATISKLFG